MVLTIFILLFVFLLNTLWLRLDDLLGKGLSTSIIAEVLFWATSIWMPLVVPLATMLASIMTMGNLGEHNELLAMKAAGVSTQRIMRPLMILVFFLSVSNFFIANNFVPYAQLQMSTLLYDVRHKRMEIKIPTGIFYDGIVDYSLRIERKDEVSSLMYNMIIYDHTDKRGNTSVTQADSGYIKLTPDKDFMVIKLFNGYAYTEDKQKLGDTVYPFQKRHFTEQEVLIPLSGYDFKRSEDDSRFKDLNAMKSIRKLNVIIDSLTTVKNKMAADYTADFKQKASFSRAREFDTLTVQRKRYVYAINCDSIFALLPAYHKVSAAENALTRVAQAITQASTHETNFEQADFQRRDAGVNWNYKLTMSISCLIFFFIGAPLGAIIRKGGLGMPTVVSIFFFLVYYVIDMIGKKLGREGSWDPALGTWLSSFVLIPVGAFLTYKSATDSAIFNTDKYAQIIKKIALKVINLFRKRRNNE
jgi:lipopolysaccharide export system permease protein